MKEFRNSPAILNDQKLTQQFPERFSNEIYLSDLGEAFEHTYVSPFSVKYVHSGVDTYKIANRNNCIKPGQCLIINNETEVNAWSKKLKSFSERNIAMSIFLSQDLVTDFSSILEWPKEIPEYNVRKKNIFFYDEIINDDSFFLGYMDTLFTSLYSNKQIVFDSTLYYCICEHLFHFQFSLFKKLQKIDKIKYTTKKEIYYRVTIAREILHNTCMLPFDLDSLARESAMSKYFLIKCFKSIFKTTPQKYYQQLRFAKAKSLLKNNLSVTEVAYIMGYKNLSGFSKQFSQLTSLSAREYKKKYF